jgi:carboxylesterase type B
VILSHFPFRQFQTFAKKAKVSLSIVVFALDTFTFLPGVAHSDDVMYILKHWFPLITATDPEAHHLEQILDMWVAFAYTGNPNNKSTESNISDLDWIPYDNFRENYLDIGDDLVMRTRLYLERYQIWETIFPMEYP